MQIFEPPTSVMTDKRVHVGNCMRALNFNSTSEDNILPLAGPDADPVPLTTWG